MGRSFPPQLRRAVVLALIAAALALVAVRGMAAREAALQHEIGPLTRVVVTTRALAAEHTLRPADLAYRQMPARWVPPRTIADAGLAAGLRTAVALPHGAPLMEAVVTSTTAQARDALARGERVIEVLGVGSRRLIRSGSRVDVVRTRTKADGTRSTSVLAEAVEVIEVRDAEPTAGGATQITATLRASFSDALKLAGAQGEESALRLLPRASWDRAAPHRDD